MSDHIEPDFADAIYEFACKLPQTIRPDILAFVVVYATGKLNEGDDVLLRLKTFLSPRMSGLSRFGATLCTIAALDYVLQRAASTTRQCRPMLHALAEQIPELDAVVLGHPLRERHFSQALDDWKKIRRDLITPQTLKDFEDRCLRPSNPEIGNLDEISEPAHGLFFNGIMQSRRPAAIAL